MQIRSFNVGLIPQIFKTECRALIMPENSTNAGKIFRENKNEKQAHLCAQTDGDNPFCT